MGLPLLKDNDHLVIPKVYHRKKDIDDALAVFLVIDLALFSDIISNK